MKNHRSQRTYRRAPYTSVHNAGGIDIWPGSPGRRHNHLRGTTQLVESTILSVAFALRHAGSFTCSHMPTWSLRLAAAVAILRGIMMTAAARVWHGRTSKPVAYLPAAAIVLERLLLHRLGSVVMDIGTKKRGAGARPRRVTHGAAVVDRSLVGCSKRAATRSRMMGQREVTPAAARGMVVACFPVFLGAQRNTQARVLPAAICFSYISR